MMFNKFHRTIMNIKGDSIKSVISGVSFSLAKLRLLGFLYNILKGCEWRSPTAVPPEPSGRLYQPKDPKPAISNQGSRAKHPKPKGYMN